MDGTRWGLVELKYIFLSAENRALLKYFHVQIKQSCKSERLVVFFWYGRDQMGPGGAEFLTMRGVLLRICGTGGGY